MTAPLQVYAGALRRAEAGRTAVLDLISAQGERVDRLDAALWTAGLRSGDESMLHRWASSSNRTMAAIAGGDATRVRTMSASR